MPIWLYQPRSEYAHLYPDDDSIETAACGNTLEDDCEACGHALRTQECQDPKKWCPKCVKMAGEVT